MQFGSSWWGSSIIRPRPIVRTVYVNPAPVVVRNVYVQPEVKPAANTVIVNVYNTNGSITPVELRIQGTVFVGPRGEHYLALPTQEQLQPVYGF